MTVSRRTFLSSAVAAGTIALPLGISSRAYGANDQIRLAVIGLHGRGGSHMRGFKDQIVALCDCDAKVLGAATQSINKQTNRNVEAFRTTANFLSVPTSMRFRLQLRITRMR